MINYLLERRGLVKALADSSIWILLTIPAYWLRIEGNILNNWTDVLIVMAAIAPIKILSIYFFGQYRRSWQYSSIQDLMNLLQSVGAVTIIYILSAMVLNDSYFIPTSIPLIEGALAFLIMGGMRLFTRIYFKEHLYKKNRVKSQKRVLIVGAGDAGAMIAKELIRRPESGLKPVGFLDDAVSKWNQRVFGIPVLGRTSQIPVLVRKYQIDELIIAMPSQSGDVIRRIVETATGCGVTYRTMPNFYDLLSGKVSINQLRNVDVEDLLRRSPVSIDTQEIKSYVSGKRVLVTGAGGSIGSEIVRQISNYQPKLIVLLGRGENSIHNIVLEMREKFPEIDILIKIADVRDIDTLEKIFVEAKPQVVFHAAAHKHVSLMEENPAQAIFNNVGGTRNLANLSLEYDVEYFVNISTDKAVNPTSVMGASKRIAEYIIQNAAEIAKPHQSFVSVRFGNVLGSRGSVIPIFKNQIKKGGPIRVTHPDMIRYFMTIPEASQLVLQAGALRQNGAVFVLDIGEPVRIQDMARDLIRLSGLEPDKDIKIEYTGIRDGEKLYEELLTAEEGTDVTEFDKIMVARKSGFPVDFTKKLDNLFEVARAGNPNGIRAIIYSLVPSYKGYKQKKA